MAFDNDSYVAPSEGGGFDVVVDGQSSWYASQSEAENAYNTSTGSGPPPADPFQQFIGYQQKLADMQSQSQAAAAARAAAQAQMEREFQERMASARDETQKQLLADRLEHEREQFKQQDMLERAKEAFSQQLLTKQFALTVQNAALDAAKSGQPLTYLSLLRGGIPGLVPGPDIYQGIRRVVEPAVDIPAGYTSPLTPPTPTIGQGGEVFPGGGGTGAGAGTPASEAVAAAYLAKFPEVKEHILGGTGWGPETPASQILQEWAKIGPQDPNAQKGLALIQGKFTQASGANQAVLNLGAMPKDQRLALEGQHGLTWLGHSGGLPGMTVAEMQELGLLGAGASPTSSIYQASSPDIYKTPALSGYVKAPAYPADPYGF